MEQFFPYSLICDFFSRNVETYLHGTDVHLLHAHQRVRTPSIRTSEASRIPINQKTFNNDHIKLTKNTI